MPIPGITRQGIAEIDRYMVEDLGIQIPMMMEHAGLNLARVCLKMMREVRASSITVVSGPGNNGGGGLVAARRLLGWGFDVEIYLPRGAPKRGIPAMQYEILKRLNIAETDKPQSESLLVDCFIGYNYQSRDDPITDKLLELFGRQTVVSLDIPTGMDCDTGEMRHEFKSLATVTLAWPKVGLLQNPSLVGELFLVDIGVPAHAFLASGLTSGEMITTNHIELVQEKFQESPVQPIKIVDGKWAFKNESI